MKFQTNNRYLHNDIHINKSKLKHEIILCLIAIFYSLTIKSQEIQIKIIGNSIAETKTIDSIGYTSKLLNTKQANDEIKTITQKLATAGYIYNKISHIIKEKDSSYIAKISLENKIKELHIYIGIKNEIKILEILDLKQDSIFLPYSQIESFLKQTSQKLEKKGYSFAKVKLINFTEKKQILYTTLIIKPGSKRKLKKIELKYSTQTQKNIFPKGAEIQINKKYKDTIFNNEIVENIHNDFEKFGFINQTKYPEILFSKDSTKVFVYLEKRKANNFDGYLGFNNSENKKIKFNGFLDLTLINAIKNGEELSVYWKENGNNQKIFNLKIEIPYILNSRLGIKGQINIFKQDSIFQNTKTTIQLGYLINYNKRIYLGFESTESSDIQNSNTINLNDYNSTFLTSNFELNKNDFKNNLFPIKNYIKLTIGTGKRTNTQNTSTKQNFVNFNIMNNLHLNKNNFIYFNFQSFILKSKTYLTNELYRFGGTNSIRGFTENSLQSNFMTGLMTEYRYLLSPKIYLNSVLDYCFYNDPTTIKTENKNKNLIGIGLGFGILTDNGLMKFSITNGKTKKEEIKLYNTNITISYNVKF
ncbi:MULTISPECIES: hypothetical protein [Flavobacterium]|uniref:hypothetical protein n=1 Tax=Flavobacterium TaxID=237 RepID=UPI0024819C42|nr:MULTISPECIES: hypothetical protein [Flavobacterium]